MKTPLRLSHSAQDKFNTCGEKYRLHYIEKLRSPKIASPLFFGNALDNAFSRLLLEKKSQLTEEETQQVKEYTAEQVFYLSILETSHNGETVKLAQNPYADYYTSDFSPELLNKKCLSALSQFREDLPSTVEFYTDFHQECKDILKAKKKLYPEDQILYNYLTWLTMVEKGYLMVQAYREQVLPQIEEVFSIQERISIKGETFTATRRVWSTEANGWIEEEYEAQDEITGLIDFTASWKDEPGVLYINDNKTSSKPYKADSVLESAQLTTYCEAKKTNKAAYVVVEKKLYKKVPIIHTQVIKSTIPETQFVKTFDNFEKTVYNISEGNFTQNWNNCFQFGRICEYYALCKHNNDEGLVKMCKPVEQNETENL